MRSEWWAIITRVFKLDRADLSATAPRTVVQSLTRYFARSFAIGVIKIPFIRYVMHIRAYVYISSLYSPPLLPTAPKTNDAFG